MIKCDDKSSEVNGNAMDILAELGMLTQHIITMMQEDFPRDVIVGAVKIVMNAAIELSGQKDSEQQRMQEVIKILKGMENGGTGDAD